jgi:hypothetical protein
MHTVLFGKPEENYHLVELGVDERIIAELILSKQDWRMWIGFTQVRSKLRLWAVGKTAKNCLTS